MANTAVNKYRSPIVVFVSKFVHNGGKFEKKSFYFLYFSLLFGSRERESCEFSIKTVMTFFSYLIRDTYFERRRRRKRREKNETKKEIFTCAISSCNIEEIK